MKKIILSILILSSFGINVEASSKPRLPASIDCDSSDTSSDLAELAGLLTIQKVMKQTRFDKMQTDLNSVKDCEAANKIMLIAIGDCVLTDRKKTNCK